jgi:leucyl aminopeptidase
MRALGNSIAGLFANDHEFGREILETGRACGEKFWPMPLDEEYAEGLKDKFADLKNITDGGPGAITAALFLREFVPQGAAWAHLDIAATAFTTKPWKYTAFGATGFGVQTLVEMAMRLG